MNQSDESPGLPFEEVYLRLRALAQRERRRFPGPGHTLNTTALVHEVYLEMCAPRRDELAPRDFFGYAAKAMRNLLIDYARRHARAKHGGGMTRMDLDSEAANEVHVDADRALELDAALRRLMEHDSRAAEVVELHYFAGLDHAQIAVLLGVSERTINRDWRMARAWLQRALGD
jgi:RNA polymerase sigma factor (TIGR02999 family)